MKKYFAYYNQYKNGIDIAFDDNVLLFISCAEAEKNLIHINAQRVRIPLTSFKRAVNNSSFSHLTPLSLIVAYRTGSDLYAGFLNIGFTCGCIIQNNCGLSTHCISLSNH